MSGSVWPNPTLQQTAASSIASRHESLSRPPLLNSMLGAWMAVPSEIELALYAECAHHVSNSGAVGGHCVLEFAWFRDLIAQADVIRLRVAPWERKYSQHTVAVFSGAQVGSITQVSHDPEDIELPWGIVSFACQDVSDGCWSFTLNCHDLRWTWTSKWPTIERGAST